MSEQELIALAMDLVKTADQMAADGKDANEAYHKALETLAKVGEKSPQSLQAALLTASVHKSAGDYATTRGDKAAAVECYQRAIERFDSVTKADPGSATAFLGLGNARLGLGPHTADGDQYDRAVTEITRAIDLDPQNAAAFAARGLAYQRRGDWALSKGRNPQKWFDPALEDFARALQIDRDAPGIPHQRGEVYMSSASWDNKQDDDPRDAYRKAVAAFDEEIRLRPDNARALERRGTARYELKDYRGAEADWVRALELNPSRKADLETFIQRARSKIR